MATSSSRLLLFRTSFFHFYRNPPPLSPLSTTLRFKNSPPLPLRSLLFKTLPKPRQFYSDASSAVADVDGPTSESALSVPHPWPEWGTFIERLKSKGYFDDPEATPPPEGDEGSAAEAPMDLNQIKTAFLNFSRDRFDILRSLSKKDIQAIVECGCPNLFRKSVNSAKRLRVYVELDEGDVCGACNLRGSCDRAYVIAKEDEGPRTVDVVRILLSYATDPLVHSDGPKPQARENVEASARKLLSELFELSDTTPDPSLPKRAVKIPRQKEQSQKVIGDEKQYQNVEMKKGDWICSKCNFMNFARNLRCLQCREDGPKRVSFEEVEMKKGDWTCPECQFMNFARNTKCHRCQEARPKRQLLPGEWECPSCDFLNYRRNMACLKCKCERPKDGAVEYGDQMWRKPKAAPSKQPVGFGDDDEGSADEYPDVMSPGHGYDSYAFGKTKSSKGDYS
ncbi:hypothetical protein MRB53_011547 [Persea americana]|uniref:Uncharacterized protein n=1 Tax=Persea americana TaxID=3435 RepID=A0ACC2LV77_PERAE|nr:hypothetical protein MRB53_011547 [Persea americana]